MEHFTPWASLCGGALIGLSAAMMWLFNGRVAGISGIIAGMGQEVARPPAGQHRWRGTFLLGVIVGPLIYGLWAPLPLVEMTAKPATLLIAGLLVGFGTRLGGGCTSGHGVCGQARLSPRSLVATGVFMATAAATVFVTHHVMAG